MRCGRWRKFDADRKEIKISANFQIIPTLICCPVVQGLSITQLRVTGVIYDLRIFFIQVNVYNKRRELQSLGSWWLGPLDGQEARYLWLGGGGVKMGMVELHCGENFRKIPPQRTDAAD